MKSEQALHQHLSPTQQGHGRDINKPVQTLPKSTLVRKYSHLVSNNAGMTLNVAALTR